MKLIKMLRECSDAATRCEMRRTRNNIVLESRVPQSGAYYWFPRRNKTWDIEIFYNDDYKGALHQQVWKFVLDRLAVEWNRDPTMLRRKLGNHYTALPRGRVSKVAHTYNVWCGDDFPPGTNIEMVLNAFNLRKLQRENPEAVRIGMDEHENMGNGDPEILQKVLGVNLGLSSVSHDFGFFDDDEYEDDWAA